MFVPLKHHNYKRSFAKIIFICRITIAFIILFVAVHGFTHEMYMRRSSEVYKLVS